MVRHVIVELRESHRRAEMLCVARPCWPRHRRLRRAAELWRVVAAVVDLETMVRAHPSQSLPLLIGDWNVLLRGEGYRQLSRPEAAPREPACRRGGQIALQPVLKRTAEFHQPKAIHVGTCGG